MPAGKANLLSGVLTKSKKIRPLQTDWINWNGLFFDQEKTFSGWYQHLIQGHFLNCIDRQCNFGGYLLLLNAVVFNSGFENSGVVLKPVIN